MMNMKRFFLCLPLLGLLLPEHSHAAVKVGQSCALTGGSSFLGIEMRRGAKAYFDKHAADSITLSTKDDGYEPELCVANTKAFIAEGARALFGYVGTPTSVAAVPLATESKTVFFGAFTGAGFLSDTAASPYAFALRASYDAEVENMMRHLKDDLGAKKIALFVQRDDFGLAGVMAALKAEKNIGDISITPPLASVPAKDAPPEEWTAFWKQVPNYRRNTVAVGEAARQIRSLKPDAVIIVGTARPAALAVNEWRGKMNFNIPVLTISFVGAQALAERLKDTENIYFSQIVPDPWDASLPVVKQYQEDIGQTGYDFVSLEGYLAAKVFHQAVASVQGEATSEAIKAALEKMSGYDAGGVKVSFGPDDHRGMDTVYLAKAEKADAGIKFVYVDKLSKPEEKTAAPEKAAEEKGEVAVPKP